MRSCSARYFWTMSSWVCKSNEGYFALSKSSSSCVRASSTVILAGAEGCSGSIDDADEEASTLRLRRLEAGWSAGSKMGLWVPEDAVLVESWSEEHESRYSSSEILSSSSRVLNFPPCMGGTKLSQRPSIRPI